MQVQQDEVRPIENTDKASVKLKDARFKGSINTASSWILM
jgi:hypothetical protein